MVVMDDKQDDVLSMDGLQSEEHIKDVLKRRTRPVVVYREINPKFKYTIEDVYKNELLLQKAQALSNLDREMVFIGEQIDKAMNKGEKDKNIYLKENDTRSYFDRFAIQEINGLLEKMKDNELYVKVDYLNNGSIRLSAETYEKVMRDGVQQTKIRYVRPIELSKELAEGDGEKGYRLNIVKMQENEELYHNKKVVELRKARQKKEEKTDDENDIGEEENKEDKEVKQEEAQQVVAEQTKPDEQKNEQPVNTQANNVVNNLQKLKAEDEPQTQQLDIIEEVKNVPEDDIDYATLIANELVNEILAEDKKYDNQPKQTNDMALTESDIQQLQSFLGEDISPKATLEMPQQNVTSPVIEPTIKEQKPQLLMTQHEMKMQNFKRAADEVKAKIVQIYGGDEKRAAQDPTYVSLQNFVANTIEKQSQEKSSLDATFDWNDPNYNAIMQTDYQNKVQAFEKRYNPDVFKQVKDRANNPF